MGFNLELRRGFLVCTGLVLGLAGGAFAQNAKAPSGSQGTVKPEQAILQALASNTVTAPYSFRVTPRDKRYSLEGRVGTRQVHDAAVRIALAMGYPITDQLVIDTAEAWRTAAMNPLGPTAGAVGPIVTSPVGMNSYIYPPPLFGRYDDPFWGLQPPAISYPPWWRSVVYRQPLDPSLTGPYPVPPVGSMPVPPGAQEQRPTGSVAPAGSELPADLSAAVKSPGPQEGTIELTVNSRGVAVLRGTVPTMADRIAVGQRLAQEQGIAEVVNLLAVKDGAGAGTAGTPAAGGAPPPPPAPNEPPPAPMPEPVVPPPQAQPARQPVKPAPAPEPTPKQPAKRPGITVDQSPLGDLVAKALSRRPGLSELPIHVSAREGVAYLSGRVPSVYEAMLAFRAAQQTPGVHDVVDRLEFVVPDPEAKNPLLEKGRPDDVEPYLEAQIRRQVGDVAHVDRVRVQGDGVEIRGTLVHEEDRTRLEAILRSIPVLRGYHLRADFQLE
jgi:osmotically-inducible protein OsmY